MARGWESKSVEGQIETVESRRVHSGPARLTPEQQQRQRDRESLELSRSRVVAELASATIPRRRESLESALRYLEEKIAASG